MKKPILLLGCCCLFLLLNAQQCWNFGLQIAGGINNDRHFEEEQQVDPSTGSLYWSTRNLRTPTVAIGAWSTYTVNHHWKLQTGVEFQFTEQRFRYTHTSRLSSGARDFHSVINNGTREQWINVPAAIQYYLHDVDQAFRPFLHLGIRVNYLHRQIINVEHLLTDGTSNNHTFTNEYETDLDAVWAPLKRWNLSAQLGIGIQLGRGELSIQYLSHFTQAYQRNFHLWSRQQIVHGGIPYPNQHHEQTRHRLPSSLRLSFQYQII